MREDFRTIAQDISSVIRFLEAKNAAIITLDVALITFFITTLIEANSGLVKTHTAVLAIILVVPLCISLVSFVPNLKKGECLKNLAEEKDDDNLFFYRHIAKYSATSYHTAVINRLYVNEKKEEKESLCTKAFCRQIFELSCVAINKDIIFGISLRIHFAIFLLLISFVIVA